MHVLFSSDMSQFYNLLARNTENSLKVFHQNGRQLFELELNSGIRYGNNP